MDLDTVPLSVLAFAQRCQVAAGDWLNGPLSVSLPRLWVCLQSCPRGGATTCIGASQALARVAERFPARVGSSCPWPHVSMPVRSRSREDHAHQALMYLAMAAQRRAPDVSLGAAAQSLGLSRFYLSRVLWDVTQTHWAVHLNGLRLVRALAVLASSDGLVKQVSWDVGYRRTGELDRQFHGWFGFSPGQYRWALTVGIRQSRGLARESSHATALSFGASPRVLTDRCASVVEPERHGCRQELSPSAVRENSALP